MSDDTTEVAILGGGVIGSAIAYFLSKAGVQTLVLERSEVAAASSSAAAGLLSPLGNVHGPGALTDLLLASNTLIRDVMPELEALSGERMEYRCWGSFHKLICTDAYPQETCLRASCRSLSGIV